MAFDAVPLSIADGDFSVLPPLDDRYALFVATELKRTAYVEELRRLVPGSPTWLLEKCAGHLLSWGWREAARAAFLANESHAGAALAQAERARLS